MAVNVEVAVDGLEAAMEVFEKIGYHATHANPAMKRCVAIMQTGVRRNFETQGNYFGKPWPALAEETLDKRAREGQGTRILVVTGDLEQSLFGGKGRIRKATNDMAQVGTRDHVARFQQGGTKTGIPARRIVGIAHRDLEECKRVIARYLTETRQ